MLARILMLTIVALVSLTTGALTEAHVNASGEFVRVDAAAFHNADADQTAMFEAVLRQDERMQFEALVAGDVSAFPTLYYNDLRIDLHDDYNDILARSGNRANELIGSLTDGPIGAESGYLTAQVASILERQDNIEAWGAAQRKAAAEGREATLADMPNGEVPYEKKTVDQWVDVPFHVFDAKIAGDLATAKLTYGPPKTAALVLTNSFTHVDGNWYISGMDSEYRADLPPFNGAPLDNGPH